MSDKFSEMIQKLEDFTRQGQGDEAKVLLKSVNTAKVPRSYVLPFANLARRHGVHGLALRLLNPIIRPEREFDVEATDREKAEYAASLLNIGATKEAREILMSLDPGKVPQARLYLTFTLFTQWEYAQAIPLLRQYIEAVQNDEYLATVGEVNLAAALVFVNCHDEAKMLLSSLLKKTEEKGYKLAKGNALELSAQQAINEGQYPLAEEYLEKAMKHLENAKNISAFYVKKWQRVLKVKQTVDSEVALEELQALRKEAMSLHHWETLREADFYEALFTKELNLFQYVYFGTPHSQYREKMRKQWPQPWDPPRQYQLKKKGVTSEPKSILDLKTGESTTGLFYLKPNQLIHKLIKNLSDDFYKPKSVGTLFSQLFPNEYFSPSTSADRVYQVVKRTRQWCKENSLKIEITEAQGRYGLVLPSDLGILVELEAESFEAPEAIQFAKISKLFGQKKFSAKQACEALKLSRSSFLRVSQWAIDSGHLKKEGRGRSILYRVNF